MIWGRMSLVLSGVPDPSWTVVGSNAGKAVRKRKKGFIKDQI